MCAYIYNFSYHDMWSVEHLLCTSLGDCSGKQRSRFSPADSRIIYERFVFLLCLLFSSPAFGSTVWLLLKAKETCLLRLEITARFLTVLCNLWWRGTVSDAPCCWQSQCWLTGWRDGWCRREPRRRRGRGLRATQPRHTAAAAHSTRWRSRSKDKDKCNRLGSEFSLPYSSKIETLRLLHHFFSFPVCSQHFYWQIYHKATNQVRGCDEDWGWMKRSIKCYVTQLKATKHVTCNRHYTLLLCYITLPCSTSVYLTSSQPRPSREH